MRYNSSVDAKKQSRGRSNGKPEPTPLEIRQCRYCKGKFEVDPQFPHKQFCKESHRKLYWKYGSQSIGKVAERIERDMRKLIAAELAGLRADIAALRLDLELMRESEKAWNDPESGEPASIDWEAIDCANERAKRGGGAGA